MKQCALHKAAVNVKPVGLLGSDLRLMIDNGVNDSGGDSGEHWQRHSSIATVYIWPGMVDFQVLSKTQRSKTLNLASCRDRSVMLTNEKPTGKKPSAIS